MWWEMVNLSFPKLKMNPIPSSEDSPSCNISKIKVGVSAGSWAEVPAGRSPRKKKSDLCFLVSSPKMV